MNQRKIKGIEFNYLFRYVTTLLVTISVLMPLSVYASDDYQYKVLFSPSPANLQAETNGRVTIYDGLKSTTVHRAMDEQYDRIENMMFVRTVYEQEDGEVEIEDDGC